MNARLFHRSLAALPAGFLCVFLAACGSTKTKSGYADVEDYATPETGLPLEEYPFDEHGNYLADVVAGKTKGKRGRNAKIGEVASTSYVEQYESSGGGSPTLYPGDTLASTSTPAASSQPEVQSPAGDYEIPQTAQTYAVYNTGGSSSGGASASVPVSSPAKTAPVKKVVASNSSPSSSKPKASGVKTAKVDSKKPAAKPAKEKKPAPAIAKAGAKGKNGKPEVAKKTNTKATGKKQAAPSMLTYRVKRGDTLYSLANRYNTSVASIKRANGMSSTVLRDGTTIKIPKGS